MEASLAIVTETWLRDGPDLEDDIDDLLHGSGIGLITLNREANGQGVAHGGVAIAFRAAVVSSKKIELLPNPENYEVLTTISTISGHSRKLVTVAAYVPPGYPVAIADVVMEAKRRYREPYVVVAGDFNQWEVDKSLEDFVDIVEVGVGPTRGSSSICLLYTSPSPRD